jgi:hypothetical protein
MSSEETSAEFLVLAEAEAVGPLRDLVFGSARCLRRFVQLAVPSRTALPLYIFWFFSALVVLVFLVLAQRAGAQGVHPLAASEPAHPHALPRSRSVARPAAAAAALALALALVLVLLMLLMMCWSARPDAGTAGAADVVLMLLMLPLLPLLLLLLFFQHRMLLAAPWLYQISKISAALLCLRLAAGAAAGAVSALMPPGLALLCLRLAVGSADAAVSALMLLLVLCWSARLETADAVLMLLVLLVLLILCRSARPDADAVSALSCWCCCCCCCHWLHDEQAGPRHLVAAFL